MTLPRYEERYAYNRWANRRLLASAALLPPDALVRDLGTSHGSVWGTLRHIVWGEWLWLGRWREAGSAGLDPSTCHELDALTARWRGLEDEQLRFLRSLVPADLARRITYENPPGTSWTYTLERMLDHVLNHSTYHRGQVATLLRQLGNEPPPTDFLVYFDELAAGTAS